MLYSAVYILITYLYKVRQKKSFMYNRDFHHRQSFRARRLIAWICVAFSLLLLVGSLVYSLQAGIFPGLGGKPIQLPILSSLNQNSSNTLCSSQAKGQYTRSLTSGGQKRTFVMYVPPSYNGQPLPVVFNYHGWDNTGIAMASYTNMGALAKKENFIVVFPQGALDTSDPPKPSWNAGVFLDGSPTAVADDVKFTSDMINYLRHDFCVDSHRIYVTGYSIGASMAYRVACDLSTQIAGLATVEGAFYHIANGCNAKRPIPFLEIHGLADLYAPYGGSGAKLPVQTLLNLWLSIDKCNTNSTRTIFAQKDVTGIEWPSCANGSLVQHYKISDGGHVWPGASTPHPDLGYTTHTIDANVVIWNFFKPFRS